ncbi:MAG: DNA repair protein RecN [Pseudomonadota bacterium]
MLTHLTINNFMLIDHLDLQLKQGMTAITGETGTGKSVLLGALGMALGERADGDRVRQGCDKADITATFLLDDLPAARKWLIDHELCHADECLLRRVVTKEGRSRAFINSQPVPLQQLKALGEKLIDIHSQHAHQSLLSKHHHQRLLDEYAKHQTLVAEIKQDYQQWQALKEQYVLLRDNASEMNARYQLLRYQVDELDQLALENPEEIHQLEEQQQTLANAEQIVLNSQQLINICNDEDQGIRPVLHQAINLLQSIRPQTDELGTIFELFNQALINVDEAQQVLQAKTRDIDIDPERLQAVEQRLSAIYTIARKHHVNPEDVPSLHQQLNEELQQLSGGDEALIVLGQQTQAAEAHFRQKAERLSQQRHIAAEQLTKAINGQLQELSMSSANFIVSVATSNDKVSSAGIDDIEFLISTNPGQSHKALAKVVSGGELSRVSLAIQVVTAQTSQVATLVFDEVDVGIGGGTADTVGQLLSHLAENSQVFCVTHLAQVASKAEHHWQVSKTLQEQGMETNISELDESHKIAEIARMISGNGLSDESLAHAKLMLEEAG